MQITDVRLRRISGNRKIKAIASVYFDEEFVVHDIKLVEGSNGLFIAMPSKRTSSGQHKDIAHPINTETRKKIEDAILEKYNAPRAEKEESAE